MKLRIVTVNDVYVLDNLPRLASLIRHYREHDPADAFLVTLPGDFVSPSILSSLDSGRGMVDCLNALGVTHVTFGNHEDDIDTRELIARIEEFRGTWFATNVRTLVPRLPTGEVLTVGDVRVGLLGVVMTDPSVYRRPPFGGVPMQNANEAALTEAARLLVEEGCAFVLPLTHQFIEDDRALAKAGGKQLFPVILGGHEHVAMLENEEGTWIVKSRSDAFSAGVIDLAFDGHEAHVTARIESVLDFPEDAAMRRRVDQHMARVKVLDEVVLLSLRDGQILSSVGTRVRQTTMGTLVSSHIRDALEAECCLYNGGGIRGNRDYLGHFTYGALKTEVPFDNEMVVVRMPGAVISAAVRASRAKAPAVESGGFLQLDDGMRVDPATGEVLTVGGEPLDPLREYRVATVRNFFLGLDDNDVLIHFAQEMPERIPKPDTGWDVRLVLASAFSVQLWKTLGGFDAVDTDKDGQVTHSEIQAAVAKDPVQTRPDIAADLIVAALDSDNDKVITRDEAAAVE